MGKLIPLEGRKFGRLLVLRAAPVKSANQTTWVCLCDCGKEHTAVGNNLKRGLIVSCGCHRLEKIVAFNTTHGMTGTRTYSSWQSMWSRCTNPNFTHYRYYGGLGVTICERWKSFDLFLEDMGARPAGTSIDRWPDPAGNYEPGNCRWATAQQQRANQRPKAPAIHAR